MGYGNRGNAESRLTEDTGREIDANIKALALAPPAGAATAAKQDAQTALLTTIDADTSRIPTSPATEGKQDAAIALLTTIDADTSKIPADPAREGGNLATIATVDFATEAKQDTIIAAQGKPAAAAKKSGSVANYAGAQIEVTGLTASSPYDLLATTYRLVGGTVGNTTQPSVGEVSGFTQGDLDDRWQASAAITTGAARTIDNLVTPIRVWSDAAGKLYIKGAAPAAADSTLYWRVDLNQARV